MNLELTNFKNEVKDRVDNVLNDKEFNERLMNTLKNEPVFLEVSAQDNKFIVKDVIVEKKNEIAVDDTKNKIYENPKENKVIKFALSVGRVFEEFIDSFAKKKLKEKFKLNYSVYNDGKKALKAAVDKDSKTFFKKSTDSILNIFKKIPSETKKIIKNTKNAIIDEIYLWRKKE